MLGKVLGAVTAICVAIVPAQRAAADAGDVIGGVIGGVIVNEATKQQRRPAATTTTRTVVRKSGPSAAVRAQNRETQTALNYFGFPAGAPDGILGRNSRNAISQYQAHMGYAPTGQLTDYERTFLVGSYHRAMSGGAATHQLIAQNPMGPRGLLLVYRDDAAGVPRGAPQPAVTVNVPVATVPAPAPEAVPEPETQQAAAAPLPSFGAAPQAASMASACNQISLVTTTNGGFTTVANVSDPDFALSEQFCLARTYAIAQGETMARQIPNLTVAQMDAQCPAYVPPMRAYLSGLSIRGRDAILDEVSEFALSTGQAPAQLSTTARICLSSGYRTDNPEVALASALLLVAMGEPVYAELIGHHLSQGFGASTRVDLARPWYELAFAALDGGAQAVFAPGQPERVQLLRAATGLGGSPVPAQTGGATVLPTFAMPSSQ